MATQKDTAQGSEWPFTGVGTSRQEHIKHLKKHFGTEMLKATLLNGTIFVLIGLVMIFALGWNPFVLFLGAWGLKLALTQVALEITLGLGFQFLLGSVLGAMTRSCDLIEHDWGRRLAKVGLSAGLMVLTLGLFMPHASGQIPWAQDILEMAEDDVASALLAFGVNMGLATFGSTLKTGVGAALDHCKTWLLNRLNPIAPVDFGNINGNPFDFTTKKHQPSSAETGKHSEDFLPGDLGDGANHATPGSPPSPLPIPA